MTLVGMKIPTSCKTACPTGFYSRFWDSCGFMAVHFAQQPFLIAISFWETWLLVLCLYRSMFVDLTQFNRHHSVRVTNGNLGGLFYRCNYSACSVMVSDSECGIFELSTNSVLFYCLHFCTNAREKSMTPYSPHQLWVKQRDKLARLAFGQQSVAEKEKSEFKTLERESTTLFPGKSWQFIDKEAESMKSTHSLRPEETCHF